MKSSVDPFDALASIFMRSDDAPVGAPAPPGGETAQAARPAPAADPPPAPGPGSEPERPAGDAAAADTAADRLAPVRLEALVPGHLPVRGSIWISPYVRAVSDPARPVALVRCDRGNTSIEVHGVERSRDRRDERGDGGDEFDARLAEVRRRVRDWIIRPVPGDEPESILDLSPDRVTVLTSGDQISVASCWEIIRRVIERADALGLDRPRLAVAVVGAERADAEALVARLDRTAHEQRGASVELRCCVPRIEPGAVADRAFDSPVGMAPADIASILRSGGGRPPDATARTNARPPASRDAERGDGPAVRPGADADRLRPSFAEQTPLGDAGPLGSVGRPAAARRPARRPAPQDDLRLAGDGPGTGPWTGDLRGASAKPATPSTPATPATPATPGAAPDPAGAPAPLPRSNGPAPRPVAPPPAAPTGAAATSGLSVAEPFSVFAPPPAPPVPAAAPPGPAGPRSAAASGAGSPDDDGAVLRSGPAEVGGLGIPAGHVIDGEPGRRPDLVTIVAGLRGLGPRCPGRESVELAVDATGTLHVLGPVEAVADLPLVADWAITHCELLAMACPDARFDPSVRPRGHVFAADPRAVAGLVRTELHLHLLAPIDEARDGAWYTVPLLGGRQG